MPIYLHLANLIVNKTAITNKYEGGLAQFSIDYPINENNYNQEDNELYAIARMKIDEFDLDDLINKGLAFDEALQFSPDFILIARYSTYLWETNWISDNTIFAWHIHAGIAFIDKANAISNTTVEDIQIMFSKGENPFATIK
ncbi:MAG: hypothetical protein K9G64_08545 [Bacteroidia bacterium]|nr:hypothetical protein [Bacteroidia bacterium]